VRSSKFFSRSVPLSVLSALFELSRSSSLLTLVLVLCTFPLGDPPGTPDVCGSSAFDVPISNACVSGVYHTPMKTEVGCAILPWFVCNTSLGQAYHNPLPYRCTNDELLADAQPPSLGAASCLHLDASQRFCRCSGFSYVPGPKLASCSLSVSGAELIHRCVGP
jgi:hypothetical protein